MIQGGLLHSKEVCSSQIGPAASPQFPALYIYIYIYIYMCIYTQHKITTTTTTATAKMGRHGTGRGGVTQARTGRDGAGKEEMWPRFDPCRTTHAQVKCDLPLGPPNSDLTTIKHETIIQYTRIIQCPIIIQYQIIMQYTILFSFCVCTSVTQGGCPRNPHR